MVFATGLYRKLSGGFVLPVPPRKNYYSTELCLERRIFRAPAQEEGSHAITSDDRRLVFDASLFSGVGFQQALAWEDPRSNRGYVQQGRERVTTSQDKAEIERLRASAPDYKETMEIGRDWDSTWKNMWPEESDVPGFKKFMLGFYQVSSLPSPQASPETENTTHRNATDCTSVSCELSPLVLIYKKTISKTKSTRKTTTCVC